MTTSLMARTVTRAMHWPALFVLTGAIACTTPPALTAPVDDARLAKAPASSGYTMYTTKGASDVTTTPRGGVYLAGGGTDLADGMTWLLARGGTRSGGGYGDVVVLRTSGSNGYNKYLQGLGANSVTTIVISSRAGADAPTVAEVINKAEVIFLAGGDQSTYVNLWRGTALQRAVNARIKSIGAPVPIGGTSAGLAVLGRYIYAAQDISAQSSTVLANPFDGSVTLDSALFDVPQLSTVITDSHFTVRDRMGRLLGFMARLQEAGVIGIRGIGVDEGSAVALLPSGDTQTFGTGRGAYYLTAPTGAGTRTCVAGVALSYGPVPTVRVAAGGAFNLGSWTGGTSYSLTVTNGVLTASGASVY